MTKKSRPMRDGRTIRVDTVQRAARSSTRCRVTHDVPWTERCVMPIWHAIGRPNVQHEDKRGNRWP
jgi:hypothetical protein